MFTLVHSLINAAFGLTLGFSSSQTFFFVLGGTLIDLDHLFYVFIAKKMFSPKKIFTYFFTRRGVVYKRLFIFHTIEFQLLSLIVSFFVAEWLFFFFLGFTFHVACDLLYHWWRYRDFKWRDRYFSLIFYV